LGHKERTELVSRNEELLPVSKQCELVDVNRSSVYRLEDEKSLFPYKKETQMNLDIMKTIDRIHILHPSWGYRKITDYLQHKKNYRINRKRVLRLMRLMDIMALYPKPNLSKRYHAKYVRPYLLRNLTIDHPDQVWGIDITYLPFNKGFLYLFVIIDWYTREIIDYEISYSLEKSFVLRCLKRALCHRKPEIMNSDQGSHFTCEEYLKLLDANQIKVSMDGKGRALDNVITERFFRSIKYEDIYLKEYQTPREMIAGVNRYMTDYNTIRPHSSLGGLTPVSFLKKYYQNKAA